MNRTIVVTSILLFSLSLFGKGRTELIYGNIYKSIITDLNLPQNSICDGYTNKPKSKCFLF